MNWVPVTRVLGVGLMAALSLGTLDDCGGKALEPYQDAPVGSRNSVPADVIEMPDGFSNAATKCDHGNRVYIIFHQNGAYGSIAVVPQDPSCKS